MRRLAAIAALLLAGTLAAAAPRAVPLEVTGDTVVVVRSFDRPVEVKAALKEKTVYTWSYPESLKAEPARGAFSRSNVLTITSAPKGVYKVTVSSLTIGKDGDFALDSGEATVVVGDVPQPGPGPGPQPTPVSPLAKALKAAYDSEADAGKSAHVKALALVHEAGAGLVRDGKAKTIGALDRAMQAGATAAGVAGKIPAVQAAIAAHMKERGLPRTSSTPIDDSNRDKILGALSEVATALKEVSP